MFKKIGVLFFAVTSFSSLACEVKDTYTISFEGNCNGDFIAPGKEQPTVLGFGNRWSQVIDDEYTGNNAFGGAGGVEVSFWTSTNSTAVLPTDWSQAPGIIDGQGNTLPAVDGSPAPYLVLFNTNYNPTDDGDLEVGSSNPTNPGTYTGGNIAIIQEDVDDNGSNNSGDEVCQTVDGQMLCYDPDDRYLNGEPHGGFVFVHFSQPVNLHSINLIDMENEPNQRGSFSFLDSSNNLLNNDPLLMTYDSGVDQMDNGKWGTQTFMDNVSNLSVSTLIIRMQGSGGFDNISFSKVEVPEPSTFAIMLAGLFGLRQLRRKS